MSTSGFATGGTVPGGGVVLDSGGRPVTQDPRAAALAGDEAALDALLRSAYLSGARAYAAEAARQAERRAAKKKRRQTVKRARRAGR